MILDSLFAVSSGFGAIRIVADTNNLKIVSQTSTPPSGVGTAGQAVPAQRRNDLVTGASSQVLLRLRQDGRLPDERADREGTTEAAAFTRWTSVLFPAAGTLLGSQGYDLRPLGMRQIPDCRPRTRRPGAGRHREQPPSASRPRPPPPGSRRTRP